MPHTSISSVLVKLDSTPVTKSGTLTRDGQLRTAIGFVTIAATTAAQTLALARIPVRARIVAVYPGLTASMGNGSVKLGIYRPDTATLKAIDDACLSAAWALTGTKPGSTNAVDAPSVTQMTQSIADAFSTAITTASATSDTMVDIVASCVTVSTGAATTLLVRVDYVLPE